jgi:flagellar motor switch protein FliM
MSQSDSPSGMRQMIVERLVGATGDPGRVVAAARSCVVRALPAMNEALARELATPVEFEVISVEIVRLAECMPDPDSNEAVVVAASSGSPDALTLQIDPAAIALLVNACFGGDPDQPLAPIERPLTGIERETATMLFEAFAKAINGKGDRAFDIRFPLPKPLSGAELKRVVPRDGPGVKVAVAVRTPAAAGEFRVLMPQRFLLENRSEVPADHAAAAIQRAAWRTRFSGEVMRAAVPLEVTVPMERMTLGQVCDLRVGQVIELPETAQAETRLLARGRTIFICEFGKLGQNYTVRVRQPYDAGREFIEGLIS